MKVYMLQGSYGKFGLTSAMFRRCSEFKKQGLECATITIDFTDKIYSIRNELLILGKTTADLDFLNPYLDLSNNALEFSKQKSKQEINKTILCCCSDKKVTYYYPNGETFDTKYIEINQRFEENTFFYNDIVICKNIYINNVLSQERYFSENGLCIAIKNYDKNGKQENILIFDYKKFIVKEYQSSYAFSVYWLKEILESDKIRKIVICDGAGSAKKITELDRNLIKTIYVLHNNHNDLNGNLTKRDYWNLNNGEKFDALIALTQQHSNDLKKDFPHLNNIYRIPNFTNVKISNTEREIKKNKLGFFGQLIDRKGIFDAILVIKYLRDQYNLEFNLDLYGTHPIDTEKAIKKYSDFSKKYNVDKLVNFHGYSSEIIAEMQTSLCTLFPSMSEAQPLTILESLASGTPVIAYDCKYGPAAMIEDKYNGFLVDVGDYKKMGDYVYELYTSNIRDIMSKNAYSSSQSLTASVEIFKLWENLIFSS